MNSSKSNESVQSLWRFFWAIIKPYRGWYLLMMQAPVISAFYGFANNYSLKLLIDAFSTQNTISYANVIVPTSLFIFAQIVLETSWRISNLAACQSQPYVYRQILLNVYDYVQYHSYSYFQSMQSGSIISKMKGILDGYKNCFASLHHKIGKNICAVVFSIFVLLLVNTMVTLFMLLFCYNYFHNKKLLDISLSNFISDHFFRSNERCLSAYARAAPFHPKLA